MAKTIKVKLVPAQGKAIDVEVEATHTTVGAVLKAAKVKEASNLQYSLNGHPAGVNDAVTAKDTVTVTEQVRGS